MNIKIVKNSERYIQSRNQKRLVVDCICHCGQKFSTRKDAITSGSTKSCGCSKNKSRPKTRKHGQSSGVVERDKQSSTYTAWCHMKSRCYTKTHRKYKNYGGRGIKVCKRWHSFENFYKDMGDKPPYLTLERIDVNGNYCPENCKWATQKEQQNNRTNTRFVTHGVKKYRYEDIKKLNNISKGAFIHRVVKGWSFEKIIKTPQTNVTQSKNS